MFGWWDLKRDAKHCEEDRRKALRLYARAVVCDLMVFDDW